MSNENLEEMSNIIPEEELNEMPEEINTTNKFNFFGVELPKIDLPKIELPKVGIPKVELPKIDMSAVNIDGVNYAIDAVKSAAKDGYTNATEAATKARNTARQTVTLVREAIGV